MLPGYVQNVLALLLGGAATGIATAGAGASLTQIGVAAGVGALMAITHLNIAKNP
ncbi:MAG: hypothetical protein LAO77_23195 [Acidobacteriia bacterium]|nr:hypothetical protein [Terriglobia bacterium]